MSCSILKLIKDGTGVVHQALRAPSVIFTPDTASDSVPFIHDLANGHLSVNLSLRFFGLLHDHGILAVGFLSHNPFIGLCINVLHTCRDVLAQVVGMSLFLRRADRNIRSLAALFIYFLISGLLICRGSCLFLTLGPVCGLVILYEIIAGPLFRLAHDRTAQQVREHILSHICILAAEVPQNIPALLLRALCITAFAQEPGKLIAPFCGILLLLQLTEDGNLLL